MRYLTFSNRSHKHGVVTSSTAKRDLSEQLHWPGPIRGNCHSSSTSMIHGHLITPANLLSSSVSLKAAALGQCSEMTRRRFNKFGVARLEAFEFGCKTARCRWSLAAPSLRLTRCVLWEEVTLLPIEFAQGERWTGSAPPVALSCSVCYLQDDRNASEVAEVPAVGLSGAKLSQAPTPSEPKHAVPSALREPTS